MKISLTALAGAVLATLATTTVASLGKGDDTGAADVDAITADASPAGVEWRLRGENAKSSNHYRHLHNKQSKGKDGAGEGLSPDAFQELAETGLFDFLGEFEPFSPVPIPDTTFVRHSFDPQYNAQGPQGPVCIAGSPYEVYSRVAPDGNTDKLIIFLSGGGACWKGQYQCTPFITLEQIPPYPARGLADFENPNNPFHDYAIVVLPYCDGSVFIGDNDVIDPEFAQFILNIANQTVAPFRYHRGVRNLSAGMDLAKSLFDNPSQVVIAGSSAGGVGAQVHAPYLARKLFGNKVDLLVLNDVGPVMSNLEDTVGLQARADDWDYVKYFPASLDFDPLDQNGVEIILYRFENDASVKDAFYETDGDYINRFGYMNFMPGIDFRSKHRDIVVENHGKVNCRFPDRYRRFILSDDATHSALVETPENALRPDPFYTKTADVGAKWAVLNEWVDAFVSRRDKDWVDIVEEYVEVYPNAELQEIAFGARCTSCWCVPEDGPDGHCPGLDQREFSYGADIITKFAELNLVGDAPTFDPPGCQPFLALQQAFPQPPCNPPPMMGEHAVCAFLYYTEQCSHRLNYRLKTFANAYEAKAAGAIITHNGECGVCSSAQDLAANMNPSLDQKSFECALNLAGGLNPGSIAATTACFVDAGFTLSCADLFTYNSINTASFCFDLCVLAALGSPNDAETCDLNDCLGCDEEKSGAIFKLYAGRTRRRSGIITPVLRDCETVANIGQDPCATKNSSSSKSSKDSRSKSSSKGSVAMKKTNGSKGKSKEGLCN